MSLMFSSVFTYDTDAGNYIQAVEAADEADTPGIGALEPAVRQAINNFVVGCKQDGIWDAIKASCILAGAKTLEGSFIDLKSATKILTNNNFADGTYVGSNYTTGDYNRKTGLLGDGSTKYLDSGRTAGADPLDNYHCAGFPTQTATVPGSPRLLECQLYTSSGATGIAESSFSGYVAYSRKATVSASSPKITSKLVGASRSTSSEYQFRRNGAQVTVTVASQPLADTTVTWKIFTNADDSYEVSNARLAFYSIGESLDLALLDGRVTDLINKFAEVIP